MPRPCPGTLCGMRVYLPSTLPGLRVLLETGELGDAPLPAYAVTGALR